MAFDLIAADRVHALPVDIARHRADAARKKTDHDPAKKWAHLTELARQREVEAAGRAAVADLYE